MLAYIRDSFFFIVFKVSDFRAESLYNGEVPSFPDCIVLRNKHWLRKAKCFYLFNTYLVLLIKHLQSFFFIYYFFKCSAALWFLLYGGYSLRTYISHALIRRPETYKPHTYSFRTENENLRNVAQKANV